MWAACLERIARAQELRDALDDVVARGLAQRQRAHAALHPTGHPVNRLSMQGRFCLIDHHEQLAQQLPCCLIDAWCRRDPGGLFEGRFHAP